MSPADEPHGDSMERGTTDLSGALPWVFQAVAASAAGLLAGPVNLELASL